SDVCSSDLRPREDRVPRSRPPRPGPSWTESSGTGYRGRPLRVRRPNASAWRRHRHARPMRPQSARYVYGVGSGFVASLVRSAPARPQDLSHSSSVRTRPPAAAFVTFCPRRPGSVVITQPRAACHENTLSQYFSGAQLLGSMISASSPDVAGAIRVFGHTFQVTSQPWVEGVLFCPKRKDLSPIPGTSSDLGAPRPASTSTQGSPLTSNRIRVLGRRSLRSTHLPSNSSPAASAACRSPSPTTPSVSPTPTWWKAPKAPS